MRTRQVVTLPVLVFILVFIPLFSALNGCSSRANAKATGPRASVTTSSTPSVSASSATPSASASIATPSATVVTMSAGQKRVIASNNKLGSSLFALTSASKVVEASNQTATPRQTLAVASAKARTSLSNERLAAYGTVRRCPSVLFYASATRTSASQVTAIAATIKPLTTKMRTAVLLLQRSAAIVSIDLGALKAAIAQEPLPPAVVSIADVEKALAAAKTTAAETLAAAADVDSKTAAAVSTAAKLSGQASVIASKTC